AWQNGFATAAEHAGVFTQLKLLYKRNTRFCITLIVSICIFFSLMLAFIFIQQHWVEKISIKEQIAKKALHDYTREKKKSDDLVIAKELKAIHSAFTNFNEKKILDGIKTILSLDKTNVKALEAQAILHLINFNLTKFDEFYRNNKEQINPIHLAIKDDLPIWKIASHDIYSTRLDMATKLIDRKYYKASKWICRSLFRQANSPLAKLQVLRDFLPLFNPEIKKLKIDYSFTETHKFILDLSGNRKLRDISILIFADIHSLNLAHTAVVDLKTLKKMKLETLNLQNSQIRNLNTLKNMRINELNLDNCPAVIDLSPLKSCKLLKLSFRKTSVRDIKVLLDFKTLKSINLDAGKYSKKTIQLLGTKIQAGTTETGL
ncbi:MAG: hypothetical protein HRT88_21050, partial [Lentisphaeraceae bacterium]|nr:hypothetical protein [Lentisphaeraceae bacterium]